MIGKQHEYEAMAKCEKELWWYKSLHQLTLKKIADLSISKNANILDAGCGTGGMLFHLNSSDYTNISGFDISPDAIKYAREHNFLVEKLDILKADSFYKNETFDVIICHDILCQLDLKDDKIALKKLNALLKPGGFLLLNLPYGRSFRGSHDVAVGIKKRYTKASIKKLAESVMKVEEITFWPFFLSPVIFSVRTLQRFKMLLSKRKDKNYSSDVKIPHAFLNKSFLKVTSLENKYLKVKPVGSSVFVVLVKAA